MSVQYRNEIFILDSDSEWKMVSCDFTAALPHLSQFIPRHCLAYCKT